MGCIALLGWSDKQRLNRLKYVANNSRFLILPNVQIKNLASKALALNLNRLSSDWLEVHEHPIFLAETFIDQSRFTGTCYRAAGFIPLGQTQGYGRSAGRYYMHGKIRVSVSKIVVDGLSGTAGVGAVTDAAIHHPEIANSLVPYKKHLWRCPK